MSSKLEEYKDFNCCHLSEVTVSADKNSIEFYDTNHISCGVFNNKEFINISTSGVIKQMWKFSKINKSSFDYYVIFGGDIMGDNNSRDLTKSYISTFKFAKKGVSLDLKTKNVYIQKH